MNLDAQVMESLKAHHVNNAVHIITQYSPESNVKFESGRILIGDYRETLSNFSPTELEFLYEHGWHNHGGKWCLNTDLYQVPFMEVIKSILRKVHGIEKVPVNKNRN